MGIRIALVVCITALGAASVALAGEGYPTLKGAKKKGGPYETGTIDVNVPSKRDLFVKVISNEPAAEKWRLQEAVNGGLGTTDYIIKWFKGDKNITQKVQSKEGQGFKLKPAQPRRFRVRVKPATASPEDICLYPELFQEGIPTAEVFFAINGDGGTCT